MRIRMQAGNSPRDLALPRFDMAVTGDALDDRGRAAIALAGELSNGLTSARYIPETLQLEFDGRQIEVEDLAEQLRPEDSQRILIESTTLGFAETFLCCRAVKEIGHRSISFLYVEPGEYRRDERERKVVRQRDFELSNEIIGYKPIPGAIASLDQVPAVDESHPHNVVFLLGFEGERMDRAIEDLPIGPRWCYLVFGVPAYKAGWELDSFANNIRVLTEGDFQRGPQFCAADNPVALIELLQEIYDARSEETQMFVAPIGTKPHGVGAALFAIERDDVGLLYDHPRRKEGRSVDLGRWHFFDVQFGDS